MNLKKLFNKKNSITAGILVLIAFGAVYFWPKIFKETPKKIYSVAIVVRSQETSDPAEDARSSLKAGDVLAVQDENHIWSQTELISYLILKMNLAEDQAAKLIAPKTRERKESELTDEEKKRIENERSLAAAEGREYNPAPQKETLLAREYRINLEKIGFTDVNTLFNGQPYADQVFDWGAVVKK